MSKLSQGRAVFIGREGWYDLTQQEYPESRGSYLVGSLVAIVRLIYIPSTVISNTVTVTVNNIATLELLFRFGILTQLLTGALLIFLTLALYRLFKEWTRALLC